MNHTTNETLAFARIHADFLHRLKTMNRIQLLLSIGSLQALIGRYPEKTYEINMLIKKVEAKISTR